MRIQILIAVVACVASVSNSAAQALPGTAPLEPGKDWARVMLDGIHRYLNRETMESVKHRDRGFKPDFSSGEAYELSLEPKRDRLRRLIGLVDTRVSHPKFVAATPIHEPSRLPAGIQAVRWPAMDGVWGEGLLIELSEGKAKPVADVVVIPDADQTPEQLAGLAPGVDADRQVAKILAEQGYRVLVPALLNRRNTYSGSRLANRWTDQSHREFVWRMAYQMGRHPIGYELQRVFAGIDALRQGEHSRHLHVYGYGEGGQLALYAAALDPRIRFTEVTGYFAPREKLAQEPIERDIWSLFREFGDAEILRMVYPRIVRIEDAEVSIVHDNISADRRRTAAPGKIPRPTRSDIESELTRARAGLPKPSRDFSEGPFVIALDRKLFEGIEWPEPNRRFKIKPFAGPINVDYDAPRQKRLFDELVDHTQKLQAPAVKNRQEHVWSKLKLNDVESFQKSQEPLRKQFWEETIGKLPEPVKDMKPRTRLILETPKWKGYEVVLDVLDNVISYGILLVPNDIKPGERRPCVVCQHGLEGRPMDVVNPNERTKYYNSFGAQLADHGFVVFAPQAPYIFQNDFRQAVRKMHPLGLTIYAFIVRQHEQILNFLETLPFVDAGRIAYYGLSYGGKVAVRIPACLVRYCAVICSGDFNEWIWKNITLDWAGSYMFTGEYEMFEFNLGNTFNYSEMTALIAPRPFMVERGHDDGVGLDEYVAFEYAKTRRLYDRLKIGDRTEIEFFSGGHEIHGRGTFEFLRRHLRWPSSRESK